MRGSMHSLSGWWGVGKNFDFFYLEMAHIMEHSEVLAFKFTALSLLARGPKIFFCICKVAKLGKILSKGTWPFWFPLRPLLQCCCRRKTLIC